MYSRSKETSRRDFLRGGAATALASTAILRSWAAGPETSVPVRGMAQGVLSLDSGWLFGGRLKTGQLEPDFDDSSFQTVTLPHTVAGLSWRNWDPAQWQDVWIYRRHFDIPPLFRGLRLFLRFDRIMAAAKPVLNGHALPQHMGGFLPFEHEITGLVREPGNVLAVAVDARWLNVPPSGSPKGPADIDYLLPGGIIGHVAICAVPRVFIADVFAKPVNVLKPDERRLDVSCSINSAANLPLSAIIEAKLLDQGRTIAMVRHPVMLHKQDEEIAFSMAGFGEVKLWDVDSPHLYELDVTLHCGGQRLHSCRTRLGFREARFEVNGFFLNGRRLHIFGLNRHELFPYMGFAMPDRVQRRDAEILRRDFNCNMVRCSHYPQSEAFLDSCDELGLMVWEEVPGWWYVGDERWQKLLVRDVQATVRRDRNRPSVIIWGVRVNESMNHPELYAQTRAAAKALDDSRPTSGTMTPWSRKNWQEEWHQDVFAYDDYHSAQDGSVGIDPPLPGVPYLVTETVGQCNYGGEGMTRRYRRTGDVREQELQAIYHAQAHDRAAAYPRCAGALAWCAFDYASLLNDYNGVKCPGITDVFRIPKLGSSFYLAQVAPAIRPVIQPNFYWDFGPETPNGPGEHVAIFSNCDRLELFVDGVQHTTLFSDRTGFPNLRYPPFFADLTFAGHTPRELRIEGFVKERRVLTRSFSSDRAADRLLIQADELNLRADGIDATRVSVQVADRFGALRACAKGTVMLHIDGPGTLIGPSAHDLAETGGGVAVWIRTVAGRSGRIVVKAEQSQMPPARLTITAG
ncbi:MAG TPA: glycoside hydrolase family 2 TIM barrel-domain containing protein [Terracidiphilus sp.]|nr:glycoside hydrolase family 2 TIM barrel-domain containing protein [Terracidiphilus sp.]